MILIFSSVKDITNLQLKPQGSKLLYSKGRWRLLCCALSIAESIAARPPGDVENANGLLPQTRGMFFLWAVRKIPAPAARISLSSRLPQVGALLSYSFLAILKPLHSLPVVAKSHPWAASIGFVNSTRALREFDWPSVRSWPSTLRLQQALPDVLLSPLLTTLHSMV